MALPSPHPPAVSAEAISGFFAASDSCEPLAGLGRKGDKPRQPATGLNPHEEPATRHVCLHPEGKDDLNFCF